MSRRTKTNCQRLPARHDVHASRIKASTRGGRTTVSNSAGAFYSSATASSRAKQHTSLRVASAAQTNKEISKSASMLQVNRTKIETKKIRKVPSEADAFFTNLLLLGFNPDEISAKNRGTSIPFDKDMFSVPNMLAFQVVMHFLLIKLDAVRFQEDFRDCWPICDRKQEQAFRKACLTWLTEISEDEDAHLPRLVPSLFLSPGGSRFYQLMMSLTNYILTKNLSQRKGLKIQYPLLTHRNNQYSDLLACTMKELVARRRTNFFHTIQQNIIVSKECEQFANDLVSEHRSLIVEIGEKERILQGLNDELSLGTPLSPRGLDTVSVNRQERLSRVRNDWSTIVKYYDHTRKERDVVGSIIKGTIDKHRLLASDYHVQVPDLLLKTRNEDIQKRNIANTVEGGRLNLISVLKLWTLSMDVCDRETRRHNLPHMEHFAPKLIHRVHDLTSYLANLRSLKNKIQEIDLPEVGRSIELLTGQNMGGTPEKFWHNSQDDLGFIPATPPISMEPNSSVDLTLVLPYLKGKTPLNVGSTPEAACRIMQSVQKRARKRIDAEVSKLPTRIEHGLSEPGDEVGELAPMRRSRPLSAPSGGNTRISTPTRPRVVNHLSASKSDKPSIAQSNKMPALKPSLHPKKVYNIHCGNPNKPVIIKPSSKVPARQASVVSSARAITSEKAQAMRHGPKELFSSPPPKSSKDRAEEALIEQIVDAMTLVTPNEKTTISAQSTPGNVSDANLLDPLRGLDETPFLKRDKIANSPVGSSPVLKEKRSVKCSPNARVELDIMDIYDKSRSSAIQNVEPKWSEERSKDVTCQSPFDRIIGKSPSTDVIKSPSINVTDESHHSDHTRPHSNFNVTRKSPYNNGTVGGGRSHDVVRHESPSSRSPAPRIYLSPLPEFDSPIEIPSVDSREIPRVQVHEPSPARLESMKYSVEKSPLTSFSIPILDLKTVLSPIEDVMDASLDLVESESEEEVDKVPTGNLLGLEPCNESANTPTKHLTTDSSLVLGRLSQDTSPETAADETSDIMNENDRVLNSDEKIRFLHQFEKSFEEEMLNLSLMATGTTDYARPEVLNNDDEKNVSKTSLLDLNDEDDVTGKPRTPIGCQSPTILTSSTTPYRHIKFTISPHFTLADSSPSPEENLAAGDAPLLYQMTSPIGLTSPPQVASPTTGYTQSGVGSTTFSRIGKGSDDIVSRFRSLKLRAITADMVPASPPEVLTPEEDLALDEVYLKESPRREPDDNLGKFSLDLHFDDIIENEDASNADDDDNNNSNGLCENDAPSALHDDSEVVFRSPDKVVQPLNTTPAKSGKAERTIGIIDGLFNMDESGLLDFADDDFLVPNSPVGGADLLLE